MSDAERLTADLLRDEESDVLSRAERLVLLTRRRDDALNQAQEAVYRGGLGVEVEEEKVWYLRSLAYGQIASVYQAQITEAAR